MDLNLLRCGGRRSLVAIVAPAAPLPTRQVDLVNQPSRLVSRPAHYEAYKAPESYREPQRTTGNRETPRRYDSRLMYTP